MGREPNIADPDGLAEVWRSAEQRRTEDIRKWLGQAFEKWRQLKTSDSEARIPEGIRRPKSAPEGQLGVAARTNGTRR